MSLIWFDYNGDLNRRLSLAEALTATGRNCFQLFSMQYLAITVDASVEKIRKISEVAYLYSVCKLFSKSRKDSKENKLEALPPEPEPAWLSQ